MQPRDVSASGLKRYIIGELLGQGVTSDVFKVTDTVTEKEYVLKQMSIECMTVKEQLRVKKEIDVMNDVDHPNIVKFRESFSGKKSVNIIMERCICTLEEFIERQEETHGQPFPEEVIIEWMAELLCALAYLHSRRILHRDIKTSNIFLTEKNHVKLGDFGVCTVLASPTVSAHGMIGTPLYFSPEVCEEEAYDEHSDVWSLGVVFYEMCTLRHPFNADHLPGLIRQILTKDVAPFKTGLDTRFEEIVRSMLSKKPRERPTAQDLIDNHLIVPTSHPSHPSQKPSRSRLIQKYYGPELVFREDHTPVLLNGEEVNVSKKNQNKKEPHKKEEKVSDSNTESRKVDPGKREERTKKQQGKDLIHVKIGASCNARSKEKSRTGSKSDTLRKNEKKNSSEEQDKTMKRIKGAKSKINMTKLRQDMLRRRCKLFGDSERLAPGEVPIVIELQQDLLALQANERDEQSPEYNESVRSHSSFLEDIAAVIEHHSIGGTKIDVEQLNDAASLIQQYKLTNHRLQ